MKPKTKESLLNELYSLDSPRIVLGLERVYSLLNKIGNPHLGLKCIHVGGTNAKGSVCAMIQSVLMNEGFKVGMFSSPHLKKFNERIRINNKLISDSELAKIYAKIRPHITDQSFFEVTTAIAFLYFNEKNVDFAVIEVGLGGRLDATNVITPLISVITKVSLDHTFYLGNTEKRIAFEKAGIIKKNVPVVTGAKGNALKVIKKTAKERNSKFFASKKHRNLKLKYLKGIFQQENKDTAMTVFDALEKLGILKIKKHDVIQGMQNAKWKGRLEFLEKNLLADGAHNEDGIKALAKELALIKKQKKIKKFIFVVGIQSTKDYESMLRIIKDIPSKIIFTKSGSEKAQSPNDLAKIFSKISKAQVFVEESPKKAVILAKSFAGKNDLVVACGSLYMIGEII